MINPENYITAAQAAKELGLAPSAKTSNISARAKAGKIPGALKLGRDWLLPKEWLAVELEKKHQAELEGKPKMGRPRTITA